MSGGYLNDALRAHADEIQEIYESAVEDVMSGCNATVTIFDGDQCETIRCYDHDDLSEQPHGAAEGAVRWGDEALGAKPHNSPRYRPPRGEEVREIPLTPEGVVLVDDGDYEWVNRWKWQLDKSGHAVRVASCKKRRWLLRMHRAILSPPAHLVVDHINGDGLDNRRANLRVITAAENHQNLRGARSDSSTGIRGVEYRKGRSRPYTARVWVDGVGHQIGTYSTAAEAEQAVLVARRELLPYSDPEVPA